MPFDSLTPLTTKVLAWYNVLWDYIPWYYSLVLDLKYLELNFVLEYNGSVMCGSLLDAHADKGPWTLFVFLFVFRQRKFDGLCFLFLSETMSISGQWPFFDQRHLQ